MLVLRVVKRLFFVGAQAGFKNFTRVEYVPVNLTALNQFDNGTEVTPELLLEKGIIKKSTDLVKILGGGELEKSSMLRPINFLNQPFQKSQVLVEQPR